MGSSYTNLNIRCNKPEIVLEALESAELLPAFMSSASRGWITVCPEQIESNSDDLRMLATKLSKALATVVITICLHDGDIFQYGVYEAGEVVDEYDSWPEYYSGGDRKPKGGLPHVTAQYCKDSEKESELKTLLESEGDGELLAERFAALLGIPLDQACNGFARLKKDVKSKRFKLVEATAPPKTVASSAIPPCLTLESQGWLRVELAIGELRPGWETVTINNTGGASTGITVKVSGDAVENELVTSLRGQLATCSTAKRKVGIPYVLEFDLVNGHLVATVANFEYTDQILLRFRAKGKLAGRGILQFEVMPANQDATPLQFQYKANVRAARLAFPLSSLPATVQTCDRYQIDVPAGYRSQTSNAFGGGSQLTISSTGEFSALAWIDLLTGKEGKIHDVESWLCYARDDNQCQDWNPTSITEDTINGITFQKAYWSANRNLYGMVLATKHDGDALLVRAESWDEENIAPLEQIISSLRRLN